MSGHHPLRRAKASLALATLQLLPACYARQPIASVPPAEPAGTPVAAKKSAPVAVTVKPEPAAQPVAEPVKTEPTKAEPAAQPVAEPVAEPAKTEPAQQNATAEATAQASAQAPAKSEQEYYVQTGSFTTEKNAEGAVAWLKERGYAAVRIVRVEQGQTTYLRVQAGPFQGYAPTRNALDDLKKDWPQAFIPGD